MPCHMGLENLTMIYLHLSLKFMVKHMANTMEHMGMVVQIVFSPEKIDSRAFFDKCFVRKHRFPVNT